MTDIQFFKVEKNYKTTTKKKRRDLETTSRISHTSQTKGTALVLGPNLVILVLSTSENGVRKGLAH